MFFSNGFVCFSMLLFELMNHTAVLCEDNGVTRILTIQTAIVTFSPIYSHTHYCTVIAEGEQKGRKVNNWLIEPPLGYPILLDAIIIKHDKPKFQPQKSYRFILDFVELEHPSFPKGCKGKYSIFFSCPSIDNDTRKNDILFQFYVPLEIWMEGNNLLKTFSEFGLGKFYKINKSRPRYF